ncbi:hypothetical protein Tco_0802350 [Tanacetum coccineum]|uniref:Uncharacterized protein n=1 Tax=Tanacetum coccineum TaxID=301880 RepID=A0ABQ5A2R3_9ASTR
MIDYLSIVETDKVNHVVETDMVRLVVEIESFGMSANELDKETESFDGLQPKQADLSTGYSKGDKNKAKMDKAKHENVKSVKSQSQQKVNPDKVKVKAEADIKEILNEPTRTHLMGREIMDASRPCERVPFGLDHHPSFLAIIGSSIFTVGSLSEHTDYQRGIPYVRGLMLLLACF